MTAPYISSASAYSVLQTGVMNVRTQLSKAQAESGSGKPADYGLDLGSQTSILVNMQQQQNVLQNISQTNAVATTRLSATQNALDTVLSSANSFMQLMIQNQPTTATAASLQAQAKQGLAALQDALNTTVGGSSIFGGENTTQPVIAGDPQSAGSPADTAFQSAFSTSLGMPSTSGSVNTITASQVTDFLNNGFSGLFDSTGWTASWSSATNQGVSTQISASQVATTSVSANNQAFADLAHAYATIASLPLQSMNADAITAAITHAGKMASQAVTGLTALQTQVGTMQTTVSNATQAITVQINTLTTGIEALDPVDPYKVATQVNQLTTQLQTAYSLTAQLQHLSLAQYL